jgi:UDP-N-acetylmuramoyl-tripeptide--D-alanyl-D-alanine ligase
VIALTAAEIAEIVRGTLHGVDPSAVVTGSVEFDSRQVRPGGLFLALPGEHDDGHDFVPDALAAGAVAAIVTRPVDGASIRVSDGFEAIAALAAAVVRRLPDVTVIGITGSSGKTSAKDMLASVLSTIAPTVAPPGSFNNELGHPYTVLRADESTRYLVLETSARGIGHIRFLAEIAPPRIGVELNVGTAHLGEFGSRAAIAQAKGELVEALPDRSHGGVAILNADDPLVAAMHSRTTARVVTFGVLPPADVRAESISIDELGRASFVLSAHGRSAHVTLRFAGAHHVSNALAAAAVALECGLSVADTAIALSAASPASRWRMELTERGDGLLVVNDAYNANPESMRAALETLAAMGAARVHRGGRTFAVLGPMAELGPDAADEHVRLGQLAAQLGVARVVVVGELARPVQDGTALEGSWDGTVTWLPDVERAIELLRTELRPADVVLVKASRAASLERVALAIADDSSQTAGHTEGSGGTAA